MINIIINGGALDLYDNTNVSWSWTAFRFRKNIQDQYTNNFTIPKTSNNIKLLKVYSLLDDGDQIQFGKRFEQAIFQVDEKILNVYIQVVSISNNEIEICLFEDGFPAIKKDKEIHEDIIDDENTIFRWNEYSMTDYGSYFKKYNYGMTYNWDIAQRHPSIQIDDLISRLDLNGYTLQRDSLRKDWRVLASNKYICPQNTTQVFELNIDKNHSLEGKYFPIAGGQHITNDLSTTGIKEVTFNRKCICTLKIYYYWKKKVGFNQYTYIEVQKNGSQFRLIGLGADTSNETYGETSMSIAFDKDDTLSFYFDKYDKFVSVSFVVKMTISNYEITSGDYEKELEYVDRFPALKIPINNSPDFNLLAFDGSANPYSLLSPNYSRNLERISFAYFGLFCNIPKITLGELFYSLQWLMGGKFYVDENNNLLNYNPTEFYYAPLNSKNHPYNFVLDNIIASSTVVGKNNYIDYKDNDYPTPITIIDNEWLAEDKKLHELSFQSFHDGIIPQYSLEITKKDDNSVEEKVIFNKLSNVVLFKHIENVGAEEIPVKTFGMEKISKSKEVDFFVYNTNLSMIDYDTIFINGHTYYIISGDIDIENKCSNIKTLLISDTILSIEISNVQVNLVNNNNTIQINAYILSTLPLTEVNLYYRKKSSSVLHQFTKQAESTALGNRTFFISNVNSGDMIEFYIEAINNDKTKHSEYKTIQI